MAAYERGSQRWPEVKLERARFDAHRQELDAPDDHAEDLFLACACADGDPEALRQLDACFLAQVPRFIARINPSPTVAEEVKQCLRADLLVAPAGQRPRIASYSGRGSLTAWLRVAAVRQVHRLRRRKLDGDVYADAAVLERLASASPDPELALIQSRYGELMKAAIKDAVAALSERERELVRLCLIDGLSIDAICGHYQVHRSTVARWIVNLKQELLARATDQIKRRLAIDTHEANSLCAAVRSQIEITLDGLTHAPEE
jgi:RNA polymerase sigma-70 factor (ECF subfamily)